MASSTVDVRSPFSAMDPRVVEILRRPRGSSGERENEDQQAFESFSLLQSLLSRVSVRLSSTLFALLFSFPLVLLAAFTEPLLSTLPDQFRNWFVGTTTTTTTNPAVVAFQHIHYPSLWGPGFVFLASTACGVVGAILGAVSWAIDQACRRQCRRQGLDGDEEAAAWTEQAVDCEGGEPLLDRGRGEDRPFPEECLHSQILRVADAGAGLVAFRRGECQWTYGRLQAAAVRAGELLQCEGVAGGALVALFMDGGPLVLVAILGTWLTGAAWFPIDREAPKPRIATLLSEGKPRAVVCDVAEPFMDTGAALIGVDASAGALVLVRHGQDAASGAIGDSATPKSIAQVIYTSGSTGLPKGVIFSHRRLAHACHFFAEQCAITEGTKVLQKTPYIWSVFRHEVYPALSHGGIVVFVNAAQRKDPRHVAGVVREEAVDVLVATPSVLELVLEAAYAPSLRKAVCMGEGLTADVAERIYKIANPSLALYNFYGSTETENTVYAVPRPGTDAWRRVSHKKYLPAGRPQPCISVHILEQGELTVVPYGATGEICFGGVLSDGYWQRPELTVDKFVEHPSLGRIYRTGDLGRWNERWELEVVGRSDRQVKIRGIRIELEEVEARLKDAVVALGGAEAAAVATPAPGSEHLMLVSFVAPATLDIAGLRRECEARMVPYMVPSVLTAVDALPRLPNQKVDLKSLSEMAKNAEETVQTLDSLGMLRLLSRAQVEEDVWIQNQQAFWMLAVMLGHFQLNQGAAVSDGNDSGWCSWTIESCLGHGKDMIAFIMMAGFTDSRDPIGFGARDLVLLVLCVLMSGPLGYVLSPGYGALRQVFKPPCGIPCISHGWFLYTFLFSRLVVVCLHKKRVPRVLQVSLAAAAALLFPDDVFDWFPDSMRLSLWRSNAAIRYKGFRWSFLFMTACYLLAFNYGAAAVAFARRQAPKSTSAPVAVTVVVGACWMSFLAMSVLSSDPKIVPWGFAGFQAVYAEDSPSHLVKLQYMMNPSFSSYVALWFAETALFIVPPVVVAVAMAYCPWHFRIMGTTCLGNYVLHPTYIGAPWLRWVQQPVLERITAPEFGITANVAIVLLWNILFCLFFAHTAGAAFHHFLVYFFVSIKRVCTFCGRLHEGGAKQ